MESLFDSLPDEMVRMIFDYLNLFAVLSCNLVCRRFRFLARDVQIDELTISNSCFVDTWFYTNQPVDYDSCIFHDHGHKVLKTPTIDLRYLKRLKIGYVCDKKEPFKLTTLNSFIHLNHLEIKLADYRNDEVISLPNLEILSLNLIDSKFSEIVAPKLYALNYSCFYSSAIFAPLRFRSPESVRHLEINMPDRGLELFKNVEIFKSSYGHANVLNLFPKLKQVHFYCIQTKFFHEHWTIIQDEMKQLKVKRRAFEKPELRIFFFGVELLDNRCLFDYDFQQQLAHLHMSNYCLTAERMPWYTEFCYEDLLLNHYDSLTRTHPSIGLPFSFFDKYLNIQVVKAKEVQSQKHFINFLRDLKNLNLLELQKPQLNQKFYTSFLPTIRSLTELTINDSRQMTLNLDFIYQLKLLHRFETDQSMSTEQMLSAFVRLKFLKSIDVKKKGKSFFIWKQNDRCIFRAYEMGVMKVSKKYKIKSLKEMYGIDSGGKEAKTNCSFFGLAKSFIKK